MVDREDVDVEVWWNPEDTSDRSAVRLTHKETGVQAESGEHDSQIANYNAALADIERQLAELDPRFAKPS
jgi:protein subunit release factor B